MEGGVNHQPSTIDKLVPFIKIFAFVFVLLAIFFMLKYFIEAKFKFQLPKNKSMKSADDRTSSFIQLRGRKKMKSNPINYTELFNSNNVEVSLTLDKPNINRQSEVDSYIYRATQNGSFKQFQNE